jgi:tetratricopeptide (TPR) repeat protein
MQATMLLKLKRPSEAQRIFSELLHIDPNRADAYYGRGLALKSMGQLAEALEDFNRAATINPMMAKALDEKTEVEAELNISGR